MGRCVLTGVQAGTAVVAQVGQIIKIGFAVDLQAARHGWEDGTETFAIATGITNL